METFKANPFKKLAENLIESLKCNSYIEAIINVRERTITLNIQNMEQTDLELKEEYLRKIEDIKNTAESLVGKIGHLQVDLFNHPDKNLEKSLEKMNNDFANGVTEITEVWHSYEDMVKQMRQPDVEEEEATE